LGRRLSVSKQAAAKTIAVLEQLGYVTSGVDPNDARRKHLQLTPRGCELMAVGGAFFDDVRDRWVTQMGAMQLEILEGQLQRVMNFVKTEERLCDASGR
jgi:DNA-binding MarR family transcriptional regulator